MSEEIFDVVNELDEVTGQRPRSEVHRLGLLHRAIHLLVFNATNELFLQKRSMTKDCFPGRWDSSASGHLNAGEEYDACALREPRKELGLELSKLPEKLFKIDACTETAQEFVWVYRCENEGPFRLNLGEISEGNWFSADHIDRWLADSPDDFAPGFAIIWQRLKEG